MPLQVDQSISLNLPAGVFNSDGLAVVMLSGGRYGGNWVVKAIPDADGDPANPAGQFTTFAGSPKAALLHHPRYPDLAVETAFIWLMGQVMHLGLRVVRFECLNSQFDEATRAYSCLARAVIANRSFTPSPVSPTLTR